MAAPNANPLAIIVKSSITKSIPARYQKLAASKSHPRMPALGNQNQPRTARNKQRAAMTANHRRAGHWEMNHSDAFLEYSDDLRGRCRPNVPAFGLYTAAIQETLSSRFEWDASP